MANLTLEDIANISFPRANFGGYRAEDVDAFIDDVQVSYDNVLKESAELKRKLAILAQKVEEYRNGLLSWQIPWLDGCAVARQW